MLHVSTEQQIQIQNMIDRASPERRVVLREQALEVLQGYSAITSRLFTKDEEADAMMAVEMMARLDATEQGKGALFRGRRRFHYSRKYLLRKVE